MKLSDKHGIVMYALCENDITPDPGIAAVHLFRLLRRLGIDSVESAVNALDIAGLEINMEIQGIVGPFEDGKKR